MARCRCGSAECGCRLAAGVNTTVSGVGSVDNPFRVRAIMAVEVASSPTITVTATGSGTTDDPLIFTPELNPTLLVTQETFDAHINDTTAAHAATAISYAGGSDNTATNVETALDNLSLRVADGDKGDITLSNDGTVWSLNTGVVTYETVGAGLVPIIGTGSPEGVVTAPVGHEYTDLNATNGAIKWIKATGVGNTGWRVTHGDTGWRGLSGTDLHADWRGTNSVIYLRRTTGIVFARIGVVPTVATPPDPADSIFLDIPSGFQPGTPSTYGIDSVGATETSGNIPSMVWIRINGTQISTLLGTRAADGFLYVRGKTSWPATLTQPWPTALPGAAVLLDEPDADPPPEPTAKKPRRKSG